jgi:hypothetical protein
MGVLLDRARKMFGRATEEPQPAEPFDVRCACGQPMTGVRGDHRQFVRCPGCGQMQFVLPENCYPVPKPPPGVAPVWPEAEEEPKEEKPAAEPVPHAPVAERLRDGLRHVGEGTAASLRSLKPPARWYSPVRLLLFAIVAVVAGTVVVTVFLSRRAGLARELASARDASLAALNEGNFTAAQQQLAPAMRSLDRYGAGDREFAEFRQLAREIAIFAELLEPAMEQVVDDTRGMSPEEVEAYFRDKFESPALILEAAVARSTDESATGSGITLDARLLVGTDLVRVATADLALLRGLPADASNRVLFGARIQSIDHDNAGAVIRLVPESGVWITSATCLEKISWPVDDETRTLLETQRKWVLERP